jgi:hypothetical protein
MAASRMLTIRPRLQIERFSLYWKEPLSTETIVQEDIQMLLDCSTLLTTVLKDIAARLGWPSVDDLQRLDGFKDPWERVIFKGTSSIESIKLQAFCDKIKNMRCSCKVLQARYLTISADNELSGNP